METIGSFRKFATTVEALYETVMAHSACKHHRHKLDPSLAVPLVVVKSQFSLKPHIPN